MKLLKLRYTSPLGCSSTNLVFIIENIRWWWSLKPFSIDEEYWKEFLEFVNIKSIHKLAPLKQLFSFIKLVRFSVFNPFSPGILWNIGIKKTIKVATLKVKATANSESKLAFSESSFNFPQNRVVFCTLYPRECTAGGSAPYNPLQSPGSISWASKSFEFALFIKFFWKWAETF